MSHAHHDHGPDDGHAHDHAASRGRVLIAFWLITVFMVVEALGGWWSGSLALLADAGHMLANSAALALAWFAARALERPVNSERSYGYDRFSVLAALINGLALIGIVAALAVEAVNRLMNAEPVLALPMLGIAVAGLVVNIFAFFVLHGADRGNLNVRAALLHVAGDIFASLAAVVAALVILVRPSWVVVDPLLSVIAGGLILKSAIDLVRQSWHVLMEGTPTDIDVREIERLLCGVDGVADIHHVHAWSLAPGKPLITLHARLRPGFDGDRVLAGLKHALTEQFHIEHSTIQLERDCADRTDSPHERPSRAGADRHHHERLTAAQ